MSRVINTDSPGKRRSQARRSTAEIIRYLSRKSAMDDEARDMAAELVYLLREIKATVDESVVAWEKRGYWLKSERFLRDWEWIPELAANVEDVVRNQAWDLLPELVVDLAPHFDDIKIKSYTRKPDQWQGTFQRLMSEPPGELPY